MAIDPNHVRVTDFGAKGNNTADDGPAIREAHEYCATQRSGTYLPLHFPTGRYLIASGSGITLKRDMHWRSEAGYATETDTRVQIRMNSDHMFKFEPGVNGDWVTMTGICFDGRNQAKSFLEPVPLGDANGRILYHSLFANCGWKNFYSAFDGRLSGVRVQESFFQNNKRGFRASGADNIIRDNYMSGSNWKAGGNSDPGGGPDTWAVELGSFRLSRFVRNYITGWPQMHLKASGSLDGTIISENWFDICDMSAVVLDNAPGGIWSRNSINRAMLGLDPSKPASSGTTDEYYDSLVRINDSPDNLFDGGFYGYVDNGLPAGKSPPTFHITGAKSTNIKIVNSNCRAPYLFSAYADEGAQAPKVLEAT